MSRYEARKRLFLKNATFCISNCVFPIVLTENAATVLAAGILHFFGIFNLLLMACKWRQLRNIYIFTLWFNLVKCPKILINIEVSAYPEAKRAYCKLKCPQLMGVQRMLQRAFRTLSSSFWRCTVRTFQTIPVICLACTLLH